ncbi:MAG TPA: hypothetical protein VFN61_07790, partial [Acidimicrobiales bacterium]|nr:hypothetical protein [Acidimicrobiales bacterium]
MFAEGAEVHVKRTGLRAAKRTPSWRLAGAVAATVAVAGALQVALPAGAAAGQGVTLRAHPRPEWVTTTSSPPGATTTTVPTPRDLGPEVPDSCRPGTWDIAPGTPSSFHTGTNAAYLWQGTAGGWTLDVTHADARSRAPFFGSITADSGTFVGVTSAGLGNDIVYLSADKRIIYFRFVNFGQLDGLGFTTHCTNSFVVRVRMGASAVPPRHEFLGADGYHPLSLPVKVSRT